MRRYLALLIAGLFYFSTLVQAAEVRKLGVNDLEWGVGTTTSPAGKVVTKIPIGSPTDNTFMGYIDVTAFGADKTGTSDSTSGIQAAFDNVSHGGAIIFPAGVYKISSGLTFKNKYGTRIMGLGQGSSGWGTIIYWNGDGDPTKTMLDVAGSKNIVIENILFLGTSKWGVKASSGAYTGAEADWKAGTAYKTGIGLYINKGSATNSTNINVEKCGFEFFGVGIQVGDTNPVGVLNNENNTFKEIYFSYNNIGYRQYGSDSMNNSLYDVYFSYNNYDMYLGHTDATYGPTQSVHIYNYSSSYAETNIYFNETVRGFYIYGGRVEGSAKFIDSRSSYTGSPAITLWDTQVIPTSGYAESPFIKLWGGGGIVAVNSQFGNDTTLDEVTWQFPDTSNVVATFINCDFTGDYILTWADNTTIFPQNHKITHINNRWYDGVEWHPLSDRTVWALNANPTYPDGYGNVDNTVTTLNVYGSDWFWMSGTGGEISAIDNGYKGQKITLVCNSTNTTIKHNSKILLNGATDFVCGNGGVATLTLMNAYYWWVEVGRMSP